MTLVNDYKQDVWARGGYFFLSLPQGAYVAPEWIGKVGARIPEVSPTEEYTYELAPPAVQLERDATPVSGAIDYGYGRNYGPENPFGLTTFAQDEEIAAARAPENPLELTTFALADAQRAEVALAAMKEPLAAPTRMTAARTPSIALAAAVLLAIWLAGGNGNA